MNGFSGLCACTHESNRRDAIFDNNKSKELNTKVGEHDSVYEDKNFLRAIDPVTGVSPTSPDTTFPNKSRQGRIETKDDEKMTVT